jgi:hypothetical protein
VYYDINENFGSGEDDGALFFLGFNFRDINLTEGRSNAAFLVLRQKKRRAGLAVLL